MSATPELYRAPIDGRRCLRIAGRLNRLKLPQPAEPPSDVPPAACFLCHPERDRFDRGAWPEGDGALRVVGNAFSIADAALLLAPPDERLHLATPAELDPALLAALLRAPFDAAFVARYGLGGLELSAFFNVGVRGAQSRVHPHLQVVGFPPRAAGAPDAEMAADRAALAADLAAARDEERTVPLGDGVAVVPRAPGMTAELWLPLPGAGAPDAEWTRAAAALGAACRACVRGLSGSYNVVLRLAEPRLARLIPRGLSEPAGLELGSPARLDVVIATSVREAALLWRAALAK
jgi:hypothetical protein